MFFVNHYLLKNSQAVKKGCCPMQMAIMKNIVKYGQEMALMVDQWQKKNDNSGEFVLSCPSFSRNLYKIHLNCHY